MQDKKDGNLRSGFTTGSCAQAAAAAAVYMLLSGEDTGCISVTTPAGMIYSPEILDARRMGDGSVSCAVKKDAGDDPDVTDGMLIYARVSARGSDSGDEINVHIDGGPGVGRVTRPGLDQPVGNAAINSVPRKMISREVIRICRRYGFAGDINVLISVPGGEEKAKETFNPRLGIEGGISIIGTSGIVEPMSTRAVIETIRTEFSQRKALGFDYAAVTFGNYGRNFMKERYGYDIDLSIKCSNFIGEAIDIAREKEFKGLLIAGHIGKMIKLAGGIMNTHSAFADCRMELMAAAAIREGASAEDAGRILDCVTTEAGIAVLEQSGIRKPVMDRLMDQILYYVRKRLGNAAEAECVMYSTEYGLLAASEGAEKWLNLLEQEQAQRI